jgi:endonuclease/exonuclease/phosphatase family metal-dependent hydrolase
MPGFSILSLNTFGVPFYASLGRLRRLAAEITRLAPTVICLQEIQQNAYAPLMQRCLANYSYHACFPNRLRFAPKGGLFTAALPECRVLRSEFFPFPNQGRLLSIGFSDWWLNKGVLLVSLEFQDRSYMVMNTHLQANYSGSWGSKNLQSRIQLDQVKYLAELIHAQPEDAGVIVCGDFNFPRQAPPYALMISQSDLTDALVGDPRPTYVPMVPITPVSVNWQIALDYFFYRLPKGEALNVTADIIRVENSSARLPFQRFLTDHKALILNIG